jgi:hypothetical protein
MAGRLAMIKIMANLAAAEQVIAPSGSPQADSPRVERTDTPASSANSGSPWNFSTISALLLLGVLWAVKLYTTWGAWGSLTVDSGHEMYVPKMLAEGKELYRDVWYMYGPAAPYFTSYLYRLFGVHLNVLYWAGSLSALGSAIFLFLTGMRLSSWLAGWTAGAVVLMEAFQPSLFSFPLPYASATVYACFVGCAFLWFAVSACFSRNWFWMVAAGTAAALALLLKPEFGVACYCTLAVLIAVRALSERSGRRFAVDVAAALPGVVLCGLVIRWMVSIAGAQFITQENIMSWPTNYFMRAYGKVWLAMTGFTITGAAFHDAMWRAVPVAAVMLVLACLLWWRRSDARGLLLKGLVVLILGIYFIKSNYFLLSIKQDVTLLLSTIFFPRDMELYVVAGAAAAWCYLRWRPARVRNFATPLVLTFSSLLAFRILMKMNSTGYPIFYNGPVVLSFLLLICMVIPRKNRSRRFVLLGESFLCLACLTPVAFHTQTIENQAKDYVPLTTELGTIRVPEHLAKNYKAAIQFMKEKAAVGQTVLSVPEDTSLYFLSGTYAPTRVYLFTPGAHAPGRMVRETIQQIEAKHVRYLLWSNRTFPEYGVPVFGRDFDQELGDYLKSNYRPVQPLLANNGDDQNWAAVIWERKQEGELP